MISICTAVYKAHGPPNVAGLAADMDAALGAQRGELVVALNGVETGEAEVAENAVAVEMGANRGVAPAWNAAARVAGGDVLVFCNDDVELGPRSLGRLADAISQHPGALVGPMGSLWDIAGGRHLAWVKPSEAPGEGIAQCDVVSGFLFACARSTWEAVGGFDEFYAPASWEDIDFCTAVRASGGSCLAVGGVLYRHEWGVSKRQMPWARARWDGRSETWRSIHRRNRRHFLEKWGRHPIAKVASDALIAG
ncbi:MAG TPA: glycosyltransferase [Solirubrobacteraceae bacterium]|nr:glycosyltransferase [Solirubrobacteraceae bacterium]